MKYRFEIIENHFYHHFVISGLWTASESLEAWAAITRSLKDQQKGHVLVDERALEIVSDVSLDFTHAEKMTGLLLPVFKRIARVQAGENVEVNRFYETVCVNRGLDVSYFLNESEAIDWLVN
ncbi:MAG: hypothetical protein AAF353_11080 [Pseudomonadota bacterium]